jgi:hypothetical protein
MLVVEDGVVLLDLFPDSRRRQLVRVAGRE